MKKRVISILMVGALAMGLVTGCGSGENTQDSQGSSKGSSGKKVTLSVLAGQSTTDAGIEEFIDAALEKKYPEIKLEWECVDWGNDFQPKMQQYMQSGLPDIMIGKAQDVSTYAPKGVLGEIDEKYLDRGLDAARGKCDSGRKNIWTRIQCNVSGSILQQTNVQRQWMECSRNTGRSPENY